MACFHPLAAWKSERGVSFAGPLYSDAPHVGRITLPCGQCVGCRLEYSRQWAVRCMHEASLYKENMFLTLTYDDAHVPPGRSLVKDDFVKFMKRMRERVSRVEGGRKFRFYYCGEYGEAFERPHFHALIFNYDFPDKYFWRVAKNGERIARSATLEKLWQFGFSEIGSVTFESAAYVARYVTKKITGEVARDWYQYVDKDGVIHDRLPEYTDMSRRPGIGKPWLEKFKSDVYNGDVCIVNGKAMRPPRYYDIQREIEYPEDMERVKLARKRRAKLRSKDQSVARLRIREACAMARLNRFNRSL